MKAIPETFFEVVYGSRLYGTDTPTSDTDVKVIYVPELDNLLLCKKTLIFKQRFDAEGNKLPDSASMPANGVETEYIPLQTFVRDFVGGQTYALELAYARLGQGDSEPFVYDFLKELIDQFGNAEVYSMVGFAMKQTFDYVKRGERLIEARKVMAALSNVRLNASMELALMDKDNEGAAGEVIPTMISKGPKRTEIRLDTVVGQTTILDMIARETGLPIGLSVNNHRSMRTLELNGRSYLESSTLDHIGGQVQKLVSQYGERTNDAAETDVDFKSLSHAIRVYQQAIEILDHGRITFPRPNAEFLLSVKLGKEDLEEIKVLLTDLDNEVQKKMLTTQVRQKSDELVAEAEQWMLVQLRKLYSGRV